MGLGNSKPKQEIELRSIPRPEGIDPPGKLQGIDVAERIMKNAQSGKIMVYFDPDWDGLVAGLFICKVLAKHGKRFSWFVNSNRQHGFKLSIDDLQRLTGHSDVSGWTVMNGDFSVSREKVRELVTAGVSIMSLDHHEVDEKELIHELQVDDGSYEGSGITRGLAEGIVCNNQYWFEDQTNLYQSGAGVTFEVLREFEPWLDNLENRALVGVTLLTDIRDLHSPRAMQYLHDLYHHPYESYIKYLIDQTRGTYDYGFGLPSLGRNYVDFNLGPKLNSMFRFNHQDRAIEFILGKGYPKDITYQKSQKDFVNKLKETAKVYEFEHLYVLEIDASKFTYTEQSYLSNFVGLLASRFVGDGRSCVAYCVDVNGELERASFRGYVQTAPYRELLQEIFNGQGHSGAFGIPGLEITEGMWERANEICAEAEKGTVVNEYYAEVRDLDDFLRSPSAVLADANQYRKGPDKIYLKYRGAHILEVRVTKNIQIYSINGHEVKCFDESLSPKEDLILPIMERGAVQFYLERRFNEKVAKKLRLDLK